MDKLKVEKKFEDMPLTEKGDFGVEKKGIEKRLDSIHEKKPGKLPPEIERDIAPASVGAPGIDTTDSPLHQNVEAILEGDLEDLYFSMNEQEQEKFKIKGEKTANEIVKLVESGKATFKKIFKLIFGWLKFIPGVNKYFLEQEAKIKSDRVLEIQ